MKNKLNDNLRERGGNMEAEAMTVDEILQRVVDKGLTIEQAVEEIKGMLPSFCFSFSCNYQPKDIVKAYCDILDSKAYKMAQEAKVAKVAPVRGTQEEEVRCDCGRYTAKDLLMTASFGKACPECYDEKS